MDRDGGQVRTVLEGEAGAMNGYVTPCWSPDGKRIAVVAQEIMGCVIIVVDAEGKSPPRRLPNAHRNLSTIDWP